MIASLLPFCRRRPIAALLLGLSVGFASLASGQSVRVFSFGGDYVSANQGSSRSTSIVDADFGTVGGPDTAFDRQARLTFDDGQSLAPTTGYNGPQYYGAAERIDYGYAAAPAWTSLTARRITNLGTADVAFLNIGGAASGFTTPPGGTRAAALYYFQKADFTGVGATDVVSVQPGDAGFAIAVGTTASSSASSVFTDSNGGNNARWMIRVGAQMYLSSALLNVPFGATTFTTHTLSGAAVLSMPWAPYNPAASLYFDATAATFVTLPNLNNVTAFGVYAGAEYPAGAGPGASHGPQTQCALALATADLTVAAAVPPPVITSSTDAAGTVGSAFTYQITATNAPTSFAAAGLPAGLTVDTGTGLISGTPTAVGVSTVTLSAANAAGTGSASLALTVSPVSSASLMPEFGAQPVGQARYPIPAGAYYVATSGLNSRTAAEAQDPATPWASLSTAINNVPSGSTIVIRGGEYRQSATISGKTDLTIQNYPGEAVWFIGSDRVDGTTDWSQDTANPNQWVYNNYTASFSDYLEYSSSGTGRAIDPDHPLAGHWDLLYIDGERYDQVASAAEVTGPGKFYADDANNKLYVWGNQAGKIIDIGSSTRRQAIKILAGDAQAGCTIRGIGVRHYTGATNLSAGLVTQAKHTTFENLEVRECAAMGIIFSGDGSTQPQESRLIHCSLLDNGQMGFSSNKCDGAVIERNLIAGNNVEQFSSSDQAGGGKLASPHDAHIRFNTFADNDGHGLWFDVSCVGGEVVHNRFVHNTRYGFHFEVSNGMIIAGNYLAENGSNGIYINEASGAPSSHNVCARNAINIRTVDGSRDLAESPTGPIDSRYGQAALLALGVSWDTLNNTIENNIMIDGTGTDNLFAISGGAMLVIQDLFSGSWRVKRSGWDMNALQDYNGYHRTAAQPLYVASWPSATGSNAAIRTVSLADYAAQTTAAAPAGKTGMETHGRETSGASPLVDETTGLYQSRVGSVYAGAGYPLPADVAAALGVPAGIPLDIGIVTAVTEAETAGFSAYSGSEPILVHDSVLAGHFGLSLPAIASGASFDLPVTVPEARRYKVLVGVRQQPDGGIAQLAVGGNGPFEAVGSAFDTYAGSNNRAEIDLGIHTWSSTADRTFRFTVTGGNPASAGRTLCIDYVRLVSLADTSILPAPEITSATTASGTTGLPFSYTITATGVPTSYGATGLPDGLALNAGTGAITGTPTAAGMFTVTLSATNATGTGTATLTLDIAASSSTRVFSFGGDYVTANQGSARAMTVSDADFGTLGGTDTAFDRKAELPFDDTQPLSPVTGYAGPVFYGAAQRIDYGYPAAPAWASQTARRVSNVGGTDAAFLNVGGAASGFTTPPGGTTAAAVIYFQKADFVGGGQSGVVSLETGDIGFSVSIGSTASSAAASVFTDQNGGNNARWMIRLGSQMYLSSGTLGIPNGSSAFNAYTLSGNDALAMAWAPYAPATSIYFDAAAATFAPLPNLNDITAFGVYAGVSYPAGSGPSASHGPQSQFALTAATADLSVGPAGSPPVIDSPVTASGIVGAPFSYAITASGSPTSFAATGLPSGLALDSATGVISGTPAAAGTTAIALEAVNEFGTGAGSLSLTIQPGVATVTLGGLLTTYNGTPQSATVTTAPAGLATSVAYDGSATPPTGAGSYTVTATVTDPNYTGSTTGTLVIAKAVATATLGNLTQTYDGAPKTVTVATVPAGLATSITYNGVATPPTNAGSYAVVASVVDPNYVGSAGGTLVIARATAVVALDGLEQAYDGTPKSVAVTTVPAGLGVDVTYDGAAAPPTYPGVYAVAATVENPNYQGTASGALRIGITALVRHAPTLNGDLDGSAQVLLPESVTLNGGAGIYADLLIPGTPTVQLNGHPSFGGLVEGSGAVEPTNHRVTLNGSALLGRLVRRIDAIALPEVAPPPPPAGTADISINSNGQSVGDPATLRNLTVNAATATVALPPGTYGNITLNGQSTLVLGRADTDDISAYNLQRLTLNGTSRIALVGPVVLRLANAVTLNGSINANQVAALRLEIVGGGLTLNGNAVCVGDVVAPTGTVIINGNTRIRGSVASDRLTINGGGVLEAP